MRILLPPSEAKRPGGTGPAMYPDGNPLGSARFDVARALTHFAAEDGAATALALPPRSAAEDLAANRLVLSSPTMPAVERYAGTVYDALDVQTLNRSARQRADDEVLVFSGLFGVLGAYEPIPYYRLPASAVLPGVGPLIPFWRRRLGDVMPGLLGDGLVVDLRSTDYAALWRPPAGRVLAVRVVNDAGKIISYDSKRAKGRLARALVQRRAPASTPRHVVQTWLKIGGLGATVMPGGRLDLLAGR